MARVLGPDGTGAYYLAANLWLYASIVADFGLGTWLTREIARSTTGAREALRETVGLRLALTAVTIPAMIAISAVTPVGAGNTDVVVTVALLGVGLIPGAYSAAGSALFNAHERMVFPAAVQLAGAAMTTVAGAVALLLGAGIVGLGAVSLAVNAVTAAIFAAASARGYFPLGATLHPRRQLSLASESLPLMLNNLLNNVFFRIDVQILQSRGSAVVGQYGNAYKVIDAAGAVPSSFVLALFPMLARRAGGQDGSGGLLRVYCLALKLLVSTALALAVLVTFVAFDLTLWLWGPAFVPHSAIALSILIWFLPLSFFNGLTQYVLIAAGRQRRITAAFAITAAFNVAANMALIPRFGYPAAAAVTVASEVVLLVPFLLAVRRQVPLRPVIVAAMRPLPAAATMAATLALLSLWSRPLALATSLVVFPIALWSSRAFDQAERRLLRDLAVPLAQRIVRTPAR
jgi:O-antigen/teichoic acid export membrane protein